MITVNFLRGGMNFKEVFGISRYHYEIHKRLKNKIKLVDVGYESNLFKLKRNPIKAFYEFYIKYPLIVKIKEKKEGVYHIPHALYAYLTKFLDPERTIVTCFDIEPSIMFDSILHSNFWTFNILGLKRSKYIVTISEYSKWEILRYLGYNFPGDRIKVVYEGVDLSKFRRYNESIVETFKQEVCKSLGVSLNNNTKILLFVGSEQPRKNLKRVIKAMYNLKRKYKIDAKLIKIGKPGSNEREYNIQLIKKLNLQHDVYFLDYVEDEKIPLYYNIADCLVLPTLFEGGFALPILEAFACGTPVVTSNIPPILEVTKEKGTVIVNPYDVNDIAKGVYTVLTDENLRKSIIKEGYRIARKYSWEKSAKDFYKIYEEIC